MGVQILIPTSLRAFTGSKGEVELQGRNVGELLANLAERYGELRKHLFTDDGKLRNFVNVYVNDEDYRYLDRDETVVRDGDVVSIVPSIAGGSPDAPELTPEELQRYDRHLMLPEVGVEGQTRLKAGSVLLVGAGGLGAPLGMYLAAAGVGRIGLVDFDVVDFSNLQRQVTYSTSDVGRSKLEASRERLNAINPHVQVETHEVRLDSSNALEILAAYDVIVDGTDNFPTRYLVNDACVLLGKPNVYGSIFRFEGQASVFWAEKGPCYRCLYEEPPPPGLVPSCAEGGVLGVLPGIVGTIQGVETIKLLLGEGEPLIGRLVLFDALQMSFRELKLRKNPECAICSPNPRVRALIDYEAFCGITQEAPVGEGEMTVTQLKTRLDHGEPVYVLDVREPHEWQICHLDAAHLVPLRTLPDHVDELPRDRDLVVHCKTGGRSAKAAEYLRGTGFDRVFNLVGGIRAWATDIDTSMPQY